MLSTDKQTNKQTNKQTDKLTNATKNITSFAKEVTMKQNVLDQYLQLTMYIIEL